MNFTARMDELEKFHRAYGGEAFLVFPEDRLHPPISMQGDLPAHWVINGPGDDLHSQCPARGRTTWSSLGCTLSRTSQP